MRVMDCKNVACIEGVCPNPDLSSPLGTWEAVQCDPT